VFIVNRDGNNNEINSAEITREGNNDRGSCYWFKPTLLAVIITDATNSLAHVAPAASGGGRGARQFARYIRARQFSETGPRRTFVHVCATGIGSSRRVTSSTGRANAHTNDFLRLRLSRASSCRPFARAFARANYINEKVHRASRQNGRVCGIHSIMEYTT